MLLMGKGLGEGEVKWGNMLIGMGNAASLSPVFRTWAGLGYTGLGWARLGRHDDDDDDDNVLRMGMAMLLVMGTITIDGRQRKA